MSEFKHALTDTVDSEELGYKKVLYILSHELHAPLRHIKEFHKIFMEDLQIKLSDNQLKSKGFIDQAIELLEIRLNVILEASRLYSKSASPLKFSPINKIDRIIDNLDVQYPNIRDCLNIKCKESEIYTDPDQFSLVCEELLSNACKFKHPDRALDAKLDVRRKGNFLYVTAEDNGIGIDASLADQALLPFSQLNGNKYPGYGAGLFLVNVIAEIHGGAIKLEPIDSGGCRALFSLPVL